MPQWLQSLNILTFLHFLLKMSNKQIYWMCDKNLFNFGTVTKNDLLGYKYFIISIALK